ncbi:hypothetical protein KUCAC02_026395 [Chaenocephalus aceratus]|uniref:Uncharacterized protein n=1 Tax=Chaenocephalus aceratus TaxID=36190 RepID=A0ACB9VXC5_CHAAC|nr:hypothetical protein KUCAC02_026395 [Chaenocephalus aceratus]
MDPLSTQTVPSSACRKAAKKRQKGQEDGGEFKTLKYAFFSKNASDTVTFTWFSLVEDPVSLDGVSCFPHCRDATDPGELVTRCAELVSSSAFTCLQKRGGREMEMAMTQAVATMPAARPGVRFLVYSTASVMAQNLSKAITHRWRMDAVQHVMSEESQMSHTICPSVQVWMTVYRTQMGYHQDGHQQVGDSQ